MIVWGAVCVNCASTVLRGAGTNWRMVEILWHRRETRRQTEKTKLNLRTGSNLPTHPILDMAKNAFRNPHLSLAGLQTLSHLW